MITSATSSRPPPATASSTTDSGTSMVVSRSTRTTVKGGAPLPELLPRECNVTCEEFPKAASHCAATVAPLISRVTLRCWREATKSRAHCVTLSTSFSSPASILKSGSAGTKSSIFRVALVSASVWMAVDVVERMVLVVVLVEVAVACMLRAPPANAWFGMALVGMAPVAVASVGVAVVVRSVEVIALGWTVVVATVARVVMAVVLVSVLVAVVVKLGQRAVKEDGPANMKLRIHGPLPATWKRTSKEDLFENNNMKARLR
mmetsp:Transcript_59291/g.180824  ORF Transcript_59291/g.180824 Transcript_59291/m.180824 type:complete len:261 (-) Transcript_59291:544-1326(-)